MSDMLKLQNGSDVRGVSLPGVPGEHVNLTKADAKKIAAAYGIWLKDRLLKEDVTVGVGRDSRLSGEELSRGVIAGLNQVGARVLSFGYASTPSMFMSIVDGELACDGAVMLTASHLPYNRNGLKFFTKDGGADKSDVRDILTMAQNLDLGDNDVYDATPCDFLSKYAAYLTSLIRRKTRHEKPLNGTKIIVDAGNGVGGFFAEKILEPLGADTSGSLYLEPDGRFPNHVPNPELKSVMDNFKEAVLREKADLGIIFDTDVDRAAVIDGNGLEINRNRIVALMSAIVLEENPGTTIVTDSITSSGLKDFIEKLGGHHHRFKRGYKNVINEAVRLNDDGTDCALAMETSGHCALKENYFLDDGAYMIIKVLVKFAQLRRRRKSLSDLIADMREPRTADEIRVKIESPDFAAYGKRVLGDFEELCRKTPGVTFEQPNYEGVRVNFDKEHGDGWCLVRMSLHDPVIPINFESDGDGSVIRAFITGFISKYDRLRM